MTVANQFFAFPFGVAGNLEAIPNPTQMSGAVSYESGYTVNYQQDLATVSTALPLGRAQFNQLMNDTTSALAQYQSEGTPQWIPPAQNPPSFAAYAYDIYARVRYNVGSPGTEGAGNQVYENQVQGNTATPGVDGTWAIIGGASLVPTGTILDYASAVAPSGFLSCCNPAPILRASYPNLFNVLVIHQTGVTLNTDGTLTGLTNAQALFTGAVDMVPGMKIEGPNIPFGATILAVVSNSSITITPSPTANATVAVNIFPWGNGDGSTTFNLPNLSRNTTIGYLGTASTTIPPGIGNVISNQGGEETYQISATDLPELSNTGHNTFADLAGSFATSTGGGNTFSQNTFHINGGSPNNPISLFQPSTVVNKIIKF